MINEEKVLNIAVSNIRRVLEFNPYKSYSGINNREEFQTLLANDPAFGALGLDDERYVIARVGGNLVTSLHRKIGDLYEGIFAYLVKETYGINDDELHYGVEVKIGDRLQVRSTDGLITKEKYNEFIPEQWLKFDGIGFEVRSCYQIGDSKRIQADYDMALALKANNIKPIMLIMCSTSLKSPVARLAKSWELYEGANSFDLIRIITGFDLYTFLQNNSQILKAEIERVLTNF
jgi:hypothetical protein